MKSLKKVRIKFIRLRILQALEVSDNYGLYFELLCDYLRIGKAELMEICKWLADHGAVTMDEEDEIIVTITRLGQDIANGRTRLMGVRRPGPPV